MHAIDFCKQISSAVGYCSVPLLFFRATHPLTVSLSDTVTPDLGSEIIERCKPRVGLRIHHSDSCFESIHQKDSITDSFCSSITLI